MKKITQIQDMAGTKPLSGLEQNKIPDEIKSACDLHEE